MIVAYPNIFANIFANANKVSELINTLPPNAATDGNQLNLDGGWENIAPSYCENKWDTWSDFVKRYPTESYL